MKEFFKNLSKEIAKLILQNKQSCQKLALKHHHADGAVCAPSNHQVLFEDKNIRVINVTLEAHEDEIFHRHERAAIMYVDMPTHIQYFEEPQTPAWSSDNLEPRFATIPFEGMHKVKNLDDKCYRAFRIEICQDVMTLANHDDVLKQILDFVQTQKQQFDLLRHTLSEPKSKEEEKLVQASTTLTPLHKAKQKKGIIRNNELVELLAEANSFKRRFYGVIN